MSRPWTLLGQVASLGLAGLLCASGCIEPNPEHDGAPLVSESSSIASASGDEADSSSGDEGMDASAEGTSASTSTMSEASSTGDGDGDGDGDTDDPFTTGGDGAESLWHYNDIDACQLPLWCFSGNQGPFSEVGVQVRAFECFSTGLTPPITIYKFAYVVADASPQLADFELQLRDYDADGPGALVNARTLDANVDGSVGEHGLEVGWQIDSGDFCIGFETADTDLSGALGLAVDETATLPDVSWFRLDTNNGGECDMNDFADVMDAQPEPTGNFCFAVSVANDGP